MYLHEWLRLRDEERPAKKQGVSFWPKKDRSLFDMMDDYLKNRNLSYGVARGAGWYPSSEAGDEHPRIVIPATASDPAHIFWQARMMGQAHPLQAWEKPPRYHSSHAPRKDALVLVADEEDMGTGLVEAMVITEGPMDALAAASTGPFFGVALMGNTPNRDVVRHLVRLHPALPIKVVADRDAVKEAVKLITALAVCGRYAKLCIPPRKDLCECTPDERRLTLTP